MRAAAFLLTISTTAASPMVLACATLAAKVAAALLKPPISDFLMFGQKESAHSLSGRNIDHAGCLLSDGWSASKFDGLIKDDHNWGGRKEGTKDGVCSLRLCPLCPSHSCRARQLLNGRASQIAIWVWFFLSRFFGKMRSMDDARSSVLRPRSSSAGWATHKTVDRGPSSEQGCQMEIARFLDCMCLAL